MSKLIYTAIILFSAITWGADIYVNHSGSSTLPFDTEAKATTSIQDALDAASAGDTVWIKADTTYVLDGVDQAATKLSIDENINVKGYYSTIGDLNAGGDYFQDSTYGWAIIDANGIDFNPGVICGEYVSVIFENLKITNYTGSHAGIAMQGMDSEWTPGWVFSNIWINGATGSSSNGISIMTATCPIVKDCIFTGDFSTSVNHAALWIDDTVSAYVENCKFLIGDAYSAIDFGCSMGLFIAKGNIISVDDTATNGINHSNSLACAYIFNNTISEVDSGQITNGIYVYSESGYQAIRNTHIFNNIIAGTTNSITSGASYAFYGYNCLYDNTNNLTLHNGDIVANPKFTNATNGDFTLQLNSPCIDAGYIGSADGCQTIGAWQPSGARENNSLAHPGGNSL